MEVVVVAESVSPLSEARQLADNLRATGWTKSTAARLLDDLATRAERAEATIQRLRAVVVTTESDLRTLNEGTHERSAAAIIEDCRSELRAALAAEGVAPTAPENAPKCDAIGEHRGVEVGCDLPPGHEGMHRLTKFVFFNAASVGGDSTDDETAPTLLVPLTEQDWADDNIGASSLSSGEATGEPTT